VRDLCSEHLFDLDIRRIFEETSSDCVFLWLRPPDPGGPLNSVEVSDPNVAYKLHISGNHPSYCQAPPELERMLVSSLLRSTGLGGGNYKSPHGDGDAALGGMSITLGRGEVDLFVGMTSPTLPPTPSSTDGSADAAAAA
jgi:hypothetical protein